MVGSKYIMLPYMITLPIQHATEPDIGIVPTELAATQPDSPICAQKKVAKSYISRHMSSFFIKKYFKKFKEYVTSHYVISSFFIEK
jgi:hypothetical protein